MENCLFCRILQGEIPSSKVYEDDYVFAFRDIQPQAPVHILVIPKRHIASMDQIDGSSDTELAACLRAVRLIASQEGLTNGYRVVSNCGPDACQSVRHLHFHILGGKQLADQMV
ncbi:MAG: histidine triad nucleotide-binding protein [Oscillospiraceae bacterium]|nr:histidine triad nucleotide-binding protein [Oscillospiraceae bacterium]